MANCCSLQPTPSPITPPPIPPPPPPFYARDLHNKPCVSVSVSLKCSFARLVAGVSVRDGRMGLGGFPTSEALCGSSTNMGQYSLNLHRYGWQTGILGAGSAPLPSHPVPLNTPPPHPHLPTLTPNPSQSPLPFTYSHPYLSSTDTSPNPTSPLPLIPPQPR